MASEERTAIIKLFLRDLKVLLIEASGLALTASSLGETGAIEEAAQKMFEIEPLLHEGRTLLNAAALQYRFEKTQ
jgi:hypothetical protein